MIKLDLEISEVNIILNSLGQAHGQISDLMKKVTDQATIQVPKQQEQPTQ